LSKQDSDSSKHLLLAVIAAGTGLLASYSFLAASQFSTFGLLMTAPPIIAFTVSFIYSLSAAVIDTNNAVHMENHFEEIENLIKQAERVEIDFILNEHLHAISKKLDAGPPNQIELNPNLGYGYAISFLVGLVWPAGAVIIISIYRVLIQF